MTMVNLYDISTEVALRVNPSDLVLVPWELIISMLSLLRITWFLVKRNGGTLMIRWSSPGHWLLRMEMKLRL